MVKRKSDIEALVVIDYDPSMLQQMMELFYNTVHEVAIKDYNQQQLDRWAPAQPDVIAWKQRLNNNLCKVAMLSNMVVGFAELTSDGHVDTMYVHKDHQGQHIASSLLEELLTIAANRDYEILTTEASITAKPFFEKFGFKVTKVKKKLYNGKEFINYKMVKELQ